MQQKQNSNISGALSFDRIRGVIWDLDNTLYRLDEAVIHAFNLSIARMVRAAGVDLPLDEAVDMAVRSFEDTGYSGTIFIRDFDIDQEHLHFNFHKGIDETVIRKSLDTKKLFGKVNISNVLVTHGAYDWARRVLSHLELSEFFPDSHILALEHYDFERKYESRKAFTMALEKLRILPQNAVMVEDTLSNLQIPHEMGIQTVYLHHGKKPDELPAYVDYCCDNSLTFLQNMDQSQAAPASQPAEERA